MSDYKYSPRQLYDNYMNATTIELKESWLKLLKSRASYGNRDAAVFVRWIEQPKL